MPDRVSTAVRNLRDYIAIPSVNPMSGEQPPADIMGERRLAEHLEQQFRRIGLDAVVIGQGERKSVVAEASVAGDADTVLIASHLDTVPVDGMEIDPFDPCIQGDRLYGRGSCDTKSGMAAAAAAIEELLSRGRLRKNVVLVGEADEECGSLGVSDVLEHLGTRRPSWALATEPTGMQLVTHHKGVGRAELRAHGVACHSSNPDLGRSAIVELAKAVLALEALADRLGEVRHPQLGCGTLSIGRIGGGHAANIVPSDAWLHMDRRLLPGEDEALFRDQIEATLREAALENVEITSSNIAKPALATEAGSKAVIECQRALDALGLAPAPATAAFGTDASLFAQHDLQSVVLGPGDIAQAHTSREYVEIPQVDQAKDFFLALLGN